MMVKNVMTIKLKNPSDRPKVQEPVTIGIPCPKGKIEPNSNFIFKGQERIIPVQTTQLSLWPDKSVKWLLCDFLVDMAPKEEFSLYLAAADPLQKN